MVWLEGWGYRKSHEVDGSSVGAQTNYQVMVKAYYGPVVDGDGVFEWFNKPSAFYYNGKTYIAWVSHAGKIEIRYYDHSTKKLSAVYEVDDLTTIDPTQAIDNHNAPSLFVDSSGYISVFYFMHDYDAAYKKRSTNPEDISSWDARQTIRSLVTFPNYPKPRLLANGTLFIFYRVGTWDNSTERYKTSDDYGVTWGGETTLIDFGADVGIYAFIAVYGNEIHVAWTKNPAAGHRNVYYMYSDDGGSSWKKRDGTAITLPCSEAEADLVFDSGTDECYVWDIIVDGDGEPYIAFAYREDPNHELHWAKHSAGSWYHYKVCDSAQLYDATHFYSGGIVIDPSDPYTVYVSKKETNLEIQKWKSADGGETWSKDADITSDSSKDNFRLQVVENYVSGMVLVWVYGDYTGLVGGEWTGWDTEIHSYPAPENMGDGYEVSLNGRCRSDFGDVRFTKSDKITELDYWMEEKVDGRYAIFWVEVDAIPADPDSTTIYLYYGKSDGTTTSDGDATFQFFDNFDTFDDAKWWTRQGAIGVSGGYLELVATTGTKGLIDGKTSFPINAKLRVRAEANDDGALQGSQHFCSMRKTNDWNDRGGDLMGSSVGGSGEVNYQTWDAGSYTESTHIDLPDHTFDEFHIYSITWKSAESKAYQDGSLIVTHTTHVPSVDMVAVFYEGVDAGGIIYVDWICVHNWVDPEPSHGAWGSEEYPYRSLTCKILQVGDGFFGLFSLDPLASLITGLDLTLTILAVEGDLLTRTFLDKRGLYGFKVIDPAARFLPSRTLRGPVTNIPVRIDHDKGGLYRFKVERGVASPGDVELFIGDLVDC